MNNESISNLLTTPEDIIKNLTLTLLRDNTITVCQPEFSNGTRHISHDLESNTLYQRQMQYAHLFGIAQSALPDELIKDFLNDIILSWLNRLKELELAGVKHRKEKYSRTFDHIQIVTVADYSITAKGLETALRLQEHSDNDTRFKQQKKISTVSVCVAALALVLTTALVSLGVMRLDLLEQKILSHNAIELHIKSNEAKINELSTKGVVVDSQVASTEEEPRSEISK
jgi:hypothetical protein